MEHGARGRADAGVDKDGAARPPVVRLILYLFPRPRCNIHRAEIDLELDLLLDLLLDLSRVSGPLSRVSAKSPAKEITSSSSRRNLVKTAFLAIL